MTVEELKIKFSAEIGNFKKGLDTAFKSTKRVSEALEDLDGDIKRAMQSSNKKAQAIGKALESEKRKYESVSNSAKQYADKVRELGQKYDLAKQKSEQYKGSMEQQRQKVNSMQSAYQKMSQVMSDLNINTSINEELSRLQGILDTNKTKALELENAMQKMSSSDYEIGEVGGEFMSYEQMAQALNKVDMESEQVYNRLNQLKAGIQGVSPELLKMGNTQGLQQLNQSIEQQKGKLTGLSQKYQQSKISMDSLKNSQTQASAKMQQAQGTVQATENKIMSLRRQLGALSSTTSGSFLAGAVSKVSRLGSALKSGATKVGSFGKKLLSMGRTAGTVLNKFNFLGKGVKGLGNRLSQAGQKFSQTMRMMKSMVLSMAVMQIFQTVTEGFKSLAGQSDSFNQQMSGIYSSVSYLKNSIIACFSNVLGAIAPIITNIVNVIASAFNKLGEFLASLGGKSTYTKAVYQQKDYNASVNESASATDKATESTKNYQKTVAGFDEITKLDSQNSSSSGSGGSSSSGDTGAWTTETVNVTGGIAESIKNGNWYEVGSAISEKLNKAMDSIKWDEVKTKVNNGVKKVTETLNGFVDNVKWSKLGTTVGEGINTITGGIDTAFTTFHWKETGKGFSDSITALFDTKPLTKAGKTFADGVDGIITLIGEMFSKKEMWASIGSDLAGLVMSVFEIDWGNVSKTLSDGLIGLHTTIQTFFDELDTDTIVTAVIDFIKGIKWLDIIWNGFKTAFSVAKFCLKLIVSIVKAFGEGVAGLCSDLWGLIKKGWEALKDKALEIVGTLKAKKDETVGKVKGWWNNDVVPYWKDKISNLKAKKDETVSKVKKWWNGSVVPYWKDKTATMKAKKDSAVSKVKSWWSSATSSWKDKTATMKIKAESKVSQIKEDFKKVINTVIGWLNKYIIDNINKISIDIPKIKIAGKELFGGKTVGFNVKHIASFKDGGFPDGEDGLFYANHNEIVGKFSNGKTAVANNDQIVEGIRQGVYDAVRSAMSENKGNSNQPIYVYVGDKQITDYVVKDVNNRTKSTGKCPIYV